MNGGEPETVGAVTADDVAAYHADRYGPDGTSLIVAGDLTGIDVVALAERTFGSWRNECQRRAPHTPVRTGPPDRPARRPTRCRAGRPAARGVRGGPHRPTLGGPDGRRLRDGGRVPLPAQQGAAGGAGLHLRGAARLLPAPLGRLVRGPGLVPDGGAGRRRPRGARAARRDDPAVRRRRRWPTRSPTTSARHRCGSRPPTGWPIRPPARCWAGCRRTTSTPASPRCATVTPDSATAAYTQRGRRRDRQPGGGRCRRPAGRAAAGPRLRRPGGHRGLTARSPDRDYLPIALVARSVAALAFSISVWYFPRSPAVRAF